MQARRTMSYTEFLDEAPMSGFLWLVLMGVVLAQLVAGLDYQSTAYTMPSIIKEFHLTPVQAGAIPAATNVGLLFGALLFSAVADAVGRRSAFVWVVVAYVLGALLSATAPNYEVLLGSRVLAGLGFGGEFPVAFALLAEYAPKRLRHIFIPLGPVFYTVGWIVAAALSIYFVPHLGWRSLYFVGVVPALMIVYIRRFVPESVRYLLRRGRIEEAGGIVRRVADAAGMTDVVLVPPPPSAGTGPGGLGSLRGSVAALVGLTVLYICFQIQTIGFFAWLPTIFVRQGFTMVRSFTYSLIITVGGTMGLMAAAWFQERMQRRYAICVMSLVGAAFFVLFGESFELRMAIAVTIVAQFLSAFFVQGNISILYTLGTELFPTPVRTLGMGIVTAFGRVGSILGPLALGFFLAIGKSVSTVIYLYTVPLIVGAVVAAMLIRVDSRQKSLDDVFASPSQATRGMSS
jgi:putative MFS transporter